MLRKNIMNVLMRSGRNRLLSRVRGKGMGLTEEQFSEIDKATRAKKLKDKLRAWSFLGTC